MDLTKYPDDDKTGSLLFLYNVQCFKVTKQLEIMASTPFDEAKERLKDYFNITETPGELRENLNMRQQEAGESIVSYARDIKLIGHQAYSDGNPELLENILIKQFTSGML